jgi:hypothetical protein
VVLLEKHERKYNILIYGIDDWSRWEHICRNPSPLYSGPWN